MNVDNPLNKGTKSKTILHYKRNLVDLYVRNELFIK